VETEVERSTISSNARMTKTIHFLLLTMMMVFSVSQAQGADWVLYGVGRHANKLFYDRETLTKPSEGMVKVWQKKEYSDKGRDKYIQRRVNEVGNNVERYEKLSYTSNFWEINCVSREERLIATSDHSRDGEVLRSYTPQHQQSEGWEPIHPDLMGIELYNAVCSPQKKK
jgi:hypothetical protein